jgi:hypothetical protein
VGTLDEIKAYAMRMNRGSHRRGEEQTGTRLR